MAVCFWTGVFVTETERWALALATVMEVGATRTEALEKAIVEAIVYRWVVEICEPDTYF
jgi:hypothetical protein